MQLTWTTLPNGDVLSLFEYQGYGGPRDRFELQLNNRRLIVDGEIIPRFNKERRAREMFEKYISTILENYVASEGQMKSRVCGECNLCCKILGVSEVTETRNESPFVIFKEKPQGVWCQYVKAGDGCGVYRSRPQACRDFSCMWLDSQTLDDQFRPDRCSVVFVEPINFPDLHILHAHVEESDIDFYTKDDHPAMPLVRGYVCTGWHVCIVAGTRRRILTNDFDDLKRRLSSFKSKDPNKHREMMLLLKGA